jgi:NADH:ubiquinone reductase (H+-translocating)
MTEQRTHVVVIGGGYAGTLAANHLRLRADVDITVVNPRPMFVKRIRLHQFVAGTGTATVDYGSLLGDGIQLVVDTADRIDTAHRTIELASGAVLDLDYLIYAVGSTGTTPSTVPGVAELAYPIAEFERAERLRDALDELHPDAPIGLEGAVTTGAWVAAGIPGHDTTSDLLRRADQAALTVKRAGATRSPSGMVLW